MSPSEMDDVQNLWNDYMEPSISKLHAFNVVIDQRIWEFERQGVMKLDNKVIERAEVAYDDLDNKIVDDDKRSNIDNIWYALKIARNARLFGTREVHATFSTRF